MTMVRRLIALWRNVGRPAVAPADASNRELPIRSPLARWSNDDLRALLAAVPAGGRIGYFAYYPDERTIDDFTGLYVTVTAKRDGTFGRIAGNHGRSDAYRSCTPDAVLEEIVTGRGCVDAFVDHSVLPQAGPARSDLGNADLVTSLNEPHRVEAIGFDRADEVAHLIAWLGRESEVRQFVTNDVEGELYAQTPGAQLLSITCKRPLEIDTRASPRGEDAIVADVSITFPLSLRIRMQDDALWKVDVDQSYAATDLHLAADRRKLVQRFSVVGHEQIS